MNKITILVVAVLAALYVLFSSVFVVNERQQAIVTRFGEITRVYKEPGLYWVFISRFRPILSSRCK